MCQKPEQKSEDNFFRAMGKSPLLSRDEERELAEKVEIGKEATKKLLKIFKKKKHSNAEKKLLKKIKAGEQAKHELVTRNLRLVVSIAKNYLGKSGCFTLLDMINEGTLGLMHAVDRFEYKRGNKLATYATWWIRQYITRALAKLGKTVAIPIGADASRYGKTVKELSFVLQKKPNTEEIAEAMELDASRVRAIEKQKVGVFSLDAPIGKNSNKSLSDSLSQKTENDEDSPLNKIYKDSVARIVRVAMRKKLKDREIMIISLRFGLYDGTKHTLQEVANMFKITRERVRQIEMKALTKLRGDKNLQIK